MANFAKSRIALAGTLSALFRSQTSTKELAMKTNTTFTSIDRCELAAVSGGAARSASGKSSELDSKLQLMMTQIGDAIKDVANSKNSGNDQLMPMMMMMMMMGGGSSGGAVAAAPPPAAPAPAPTYVRVNVRG